MGVISRIWEQKQWPVKPAVKAGGTVILGADKLEAMLDEAGAGRPWDRKILLRIFKEAARPMVEAMKLNAPISDKNVALLAQRHFTKKKGIHYKLAFHKPGQLKRSIGVVEGKGRIIYIGPRIGKKALLGADGWYARFVEYGIPSRKYKANPFLRRSIDATKDAVLKFIVDNLADYYIGWLNAKNLKS